MVEPFPHPGNILSLVRVGACGQGTCGLSVQECAPGVIGQLALQLLFEGVGKKKRQSWGVRALLYYGLKVQEDRQKWNVKTRTGRDRLYGGE